MMFLRNAMLLLAVGRHAMAQFDFTVDTNNQGATTAAVVNGNDLIITVGHPDLSTAGGSLAATFFNPTCTTTVAVASPISTTVSTVVDPNDTKSSLTNSLPDLAGNSALFAAATTAPAGQYNFCVRFEYKPAGASGFTSFIYIKISFAVNVDGDVSSGIDTEASGPVDGGVASESITVRMFPCDPNNVLALASPPLNPAIYGEIGQSAAVYSQEEKVTMCLEINEPTLAGITGIFSMSFATTTPSLTQDAYVNGAVRPLTSAHTCVSSKHCHFQTTLLGTFFTLNGSSGAPVRLDVNVNGVVTVIILANRRLVRKRARFVLQAGELTTKTVGSAITAQAAVDDVDACSSCSDWFFLFKIICWIINCLFRG